MFFVYNKDRIISVVIALSTVLVLFLIAGVMDKKDISNTIQTSTNINEKIITSNENCVNNINEVQYED